MTRNYIIAGVGIVLILLAGWYSYSHPKIAPQPTAPISQEPQTIVGYWECLPHKDRSGPQTTECAFGIAVDQSDGHYAIDTSLMSTYPVDYPTGTKLRVTGLVTPVEALSSIQKYNIDGIIRATTIEKL